MIRYVQLLIQRDGRVWLMPERTLLGTVARERRGKTPKAEWRSKCDRCRPWWSAIARTRREALHCLIDHWNEHQTNERGE